MNIELLWSVKCCRTCSQLIGISYCPKLDRSVDYMNICMCYKPKEILKEGNDE